MKALALCLLALPAAASAVSVGTSGGQFLELPASAHAAALAGADVALARGAEGMEYNPARLATLSDWDLVADHVAYLAGINLEQVGAAWGRSGMGLGLNVVELASPQVPQTDALGNQIGTFGEQDLAVALGGAMSWGSLSAGLTARWVRMTLAGYGAGGAEGDLGLAWQPLPSWHLGLALQHLGSYSAYGSVADPTPMLLRGGLGWEQAFDNGLSLSLEADAVDPRDGTLQLRGGGELGWSAFFIRVGGLWSQDFDSQQTSTLGAGVRLGDVTLDYAFGDFTGLGATQRFGLSWRPGAVLAPRPRGVPSGLRALREGGDLLLSWWQAARAIGSTCAGPMARIRSGWASCPSKGPRCGCIGPPPWATWAWPWPAWPRTAAKAPARMSCGWTAAKVRPRRCRPPRRCCCPDKAPSAC